MKEIITPGGRLVLYPDTNIDLSKNNPLYTSAEEFSIDLTVPRKPNDAVLGYMYRLAGMKSVEPIEAVFRFRRREKLTGSIEVTAVDDAEYSLILKGSRSDFLFRWGKTLLSDLDFQWENFIPGQSSANEFELAAEMKETLTQQRDWICFPVWCVDEQRWINRWSIDTQSFPWDPGGWRTPFPRIGRTLEKLFALKGYTVTENWFTATGERKNLVFFNNASAVADQVSLKYMLPDWTVADMISELENYFPVTFFIHSRTRKVRILGDDTLADGDAAATLDSWLKFNPKVLYNERKQGYQLNYELPDDDETADNEWEYADEESATELSKYDDLPTNPQEGALYRILSEGQYYQAKYTKVEENDILSWERKASVAMSVRSGLEEIERTTKIYPLTNFRSEVKETVTLTQQYVGTQRKEVTFWLQTPVTAKTQIRWKDDLRTMCYRTIVNAEYDASDVTAGYSLPLIYYPLANFVARDNVGNVIANSLVELRWDGEKGLRGAEAISFLNNALTVEGELVMSHLDIEKLDLAKPVALMGRKGMIEELVCHYGDSAMVECDVRVKVK